jgi:pyruvate,water dikinase
LCHTAVIARELGIAAVVGVEGALDIPDGAEVEVDPVAGRVNLVGA